MKRILGPFMAKNMMLSGEARQVQRQAEREASEFVTFMAERSGLLDAHAEGYSFGDHLTVQEYLAASYLIDNVRGPAEWVDFLAGRAGQSWWQEVFLLMAGYLLRRSEQARRFVLEELGALPGARRRSRLRAGLGRSRPAGDPAAASGLARRARAPNWPAGWCVCCGRTRRRPRCAARVEAGEVLGRLGDPRFSGPDLLPEFIPIPGGILDGQR